MSDPSPREWRFYIADMIGFAEKVVAYTAGFDQERFTASGLNYDATLRNLELIGEVSGHVPDTIRAAHRQVPWRLVIATRRQSFALGAAGRKSAPVLGPDSRA